MGGDQADRPQRHQRTRPLPPHDRDELRAGRQSLGNALKDGIVNALHGLASLVGQAARAAINAVIDAFNALGDITIPVPLAPDIHVNFPDIPHVATGGHVMRSGLAVIHKGEDVIPASRSGGGGRVQVIVLGGDQAAIEWLDRALTGASRRGWRGRSL